MSSLPVVPASRYQHIFRKDLRLLWPLAFASAAGQALLTAVTFHADPFSIGDQRSALAAVVTLGLIISMVLLILLTVHQDPIPGVSQDWLIRPIRRRDLLGAKLLSVLLLIHGPIVVLKLVAGVAEGFPPGALLRAVLLSNFEIAVVFSLPVMTVAALTRNVGEAVIVGLVLFAGMLLSRLLILAALYPFTHSFHFAGSADEQGIAWVGRSLSHAVLLGVMVLVLRMQYFRRATSESRELFAVGLFLFVLTASLPWKPAFLIQQGLAADPGAGAAVSVAFEPNAPGAQPAGRIINPDSRKFAAEAGSDKARVSVVVPVRVTGLPDGLILHTDRSSVRLVRSDGKSVFRGSGHVFDIRAPEADADGAGSTGGSVVGQLLQVPAALFRKYSQEPLRLEVDYSLSLLRVRRLPPLALPDGELNDPQFGHCATRVESDHTAIAVACRQVGELPCMSAALVEPGSGRRNPDAFDCTLSYEPASLRFGTEPMDHVQVSLPFRDPSGVASYPVDESRLAGAQVQLSAYEPVDHFTRRLVIWPFHLQGARSP